MSRKKPKGSFYDEVKVVETVSKFSIFYSFLLTLAMIFPLAAIVSMWV